LNINFPSKDSYPTKILQLLIVSNACYIGDSLERKVYVLYHKPEVRRKDLWIVRAVVQVVGNCVIIEVMLAGFTYSVIW